eukprot:1864323-Prymnesium_polylepis.1
MDCAMRCRCAMADPRFRMCTRPADRATPPRGRPARSRPPRRPRARAPPTARTAPRSRAAGDEHEAIAERLIRISLRIDMKIGGRPRAPSIEVLEYISED